MPVLVLSGPGEPMPTPSTFFPDSAMDAFASFTIREMTASAPWADIVGSETTPRISEPSSATVPATRFVPPTSTPTT